VPCNLTCSWGLIPSCANEMTPSTGSHTSSADIPIRNVTAAGSLAASLAY
jgi:hypothetical protein